MRKLILILMVAPLLSHAKLSTDSLWGVWRSNTQADSSRLNAINELIKQDYIFTQPDSAFHLAQLQLKLAEKAENKEFMARANLNQGVALYFQSQFDEALELYKKSLQFYEEIQSLEGIAKTLVNMGIIFTKKGENQKAIETYEETLDIYRSLGNKEGIARSLNNISAIYGELGNYKQGIEATAQALKIYEEINYKSGISLCINNLGVMYNYLNELDQAVDYFKKSLRYSKKINRPNNVGNTLINIGVIYTKQAKFDTASYYLRGGLKIFRTTHNYSGEALALQSIGSVYQGTDQPDSARFYYQESLELYKKIGDPHGIAVSTFSLGNAYSRLNNEKKAMLLYTKALSIAKEINAVKTVKETTKALWKGYRKRGDYKQALAMHELFISAKDTMNSEENQKAAIRLQYQYEYEKQAAADSIKAAEEQKVINAELAAEKAVNRQYEIETKRQALQNYALFGGFAITLLFSGFIYNRVRVINRQKNIIQEQKYEVDLAYDQLDVKNKEVHDSIVYAKRIQSAILPPDQMIKKYLSNSFVLYKPKDIVSGDFYWMEPLEDKLLFAAADCTGHGVPGAMVSVICTNSLNRAVREYGYSEPGMILSKAREIIISEFAKSGEEVRDGMDIALCSLEKDTLKFAGANNPLWIIRNGADEIDQLRADRQPVGKFDNPKPYYTHTIQLKPGDTIYLFSDGYADQFGGSLGKKLKSSYFKKLLLSFQDKPMDEQKELLDNALEKWKGDLEQVDDICVIGFRKEDDTINNKS